jgi:hypothetical protein
MSFRRRLYRYGLFGGGSALLGWAASDFLGLPNGLPGGLFGETLTCGLIGGTIGAGLNIAGPGIAASRSRMIGRAVAGLIIGGLASAIGASIGHALLGTFFGARAVSWTLMGAGIGAAEGLYERSPILLRRGAILGALGGLVGGLPFAVVYAVLSPLWEIGSRAAAFVLFGSCVGVSTGLAELVFGNGRPPVGAGASRNQQPIPVKSADRPRVVPVPASETRSKPGPVAPQAKSNAVGAPKRQTTGVKPCPKCKRPVPGTRPYCVVCKISF